MTREWRVPLGASSREAGALERLQFTTEEGPCWDAIRRDSPVAADEAEIAARWPRFAADMRAVSSLRSVVSVPLRLARSTGGAVDLYFADPGGAGGFDVDDGTVIAAHVADLLNRAAESSPPDPHGVAGPAWAQGAPARGRLAVWIAVGMVAGETGSAPADALALLRAAAYSAGGPWTTSPPTW